MEPQFDEPQYNKVLGINDILQSGLLECIEEHPEINQFPLSLGTLFDQGYTVQKHNPQLPVKIDGKCEVREAGIYLGFCCQCNLLTVAC